MEMIYSSALGNLQPRTAVHLSVKMGGCWAHTWQATELPAILTLMGKSSNTMQK